MKSLFKDKLTFKTEVQIDLQMIQNLLDNSRSPLYCSWMQYLSTDIQSEATRFNGELNVVKLLMLGGTLPVYDKEEAELTKLGEINVLNIIRALQAMALGEDLKGKKYDTLKNHFKDFVNGNDDAITVDVIIQIAVMGEVAFG